MDDRGRRLCMHCDYDLRGIDPGMPCPECGMPAYNRREALDGRAITLRRLRQIESMLLIPLAMLVCAGLVVLVAMALMM